MLNNYLQHQEWPHFPSASIKAAREQVYEIQKSQVQNYQRKKQSINFASVMLWEGKEMEVFFIYTGVHFPLFLISTSAPLYIFLHVQALVGVCQGRGGFSAVVQVSMPYCISQTGLSTRCFNESLYVVLLFLHHVAGGPGHWKSWAMRVGFFMRNPLKTLSLPFQSLHSAMNAIKPTNQPKTLPSQ